MAIVSVNLLRYVRLVPWSRDYQPFGRCRSCLCPLLLSTGNLQTLGRLHSLDILRFLLIEQPLGFVYFGREKVVMFLELCHILPKGSDLSQKLRLGGSLNYWCITKGSARGQRRASTALPAKR
ncbi:unnamed protein product [Prunus armeniaca]